MPLRANVAVSPSSESAGTAGPRSGVRSEWLGIALLACALVFNAYFLAPELWIARVPVNDMVFHLAGSERLAQSLSRGEPFLDPWVSEWAVGYPVWRSYQPLPHLVAAAGLWLAAPFLDHAGAFAALQYALSVLLPLTTYVGSRLLGLGPLGSGIASLLVFAPAGTGELDRYGLSYGAITWRGSGLYTQLFALHLLILSLGMVTRALDSGRRRAHTSMLLAATALSHIIFGYIAFVSSALMAVVGPQGQRSRRLVRLATIVLPACLLLAWFVVPLVLARNEVNHSRWEPAFKWDSFGAPFILSELFSGRLLDAGRPPLLSLLVAGGTIAGFCALRETVARRLLALAGLWLLLFFGRETWGHLLLLAGVPGDLPLHRLQAAFELAAVLLAAWGVERTTIQAVSRNRWVALAAAAGVAAATLTLGGERAHYLQQNAAWGEENLVAFGRERADLEAALADVRQILAERPGRVAAGKAASWGSEFKVGSVPVFALLTREHFDQVSFLYHAMSLPAEVMVLRDEADPAHDVAFGVRAVIAPSTQPMPSHLRPRATHGRFAVYEASPEGYFGLVDIGARYTGGLATAFEPNAAWLTSPLLRSGVVVALDAAVAGVPAIGRWEPMPTPAPSLLRARGRIVSETKRGETYRARLSLDRPCYALVKITWYPALRATVDGARVSAIRVTPGFVAVPVPAGEHAVEVRYAPGPLKPLLLFAGLVLCGLCGWVLRQPSASTAEDVGTKRLANLGSRLATPRALTAVALAALVILALRPLFRGRLIEGHDVTVYPPRLAEMARTLGEGYLLPIWAADLGNGHGQPLFEFAPPLVTLAAFPLHLVGLRLADSLQIALAILFAVGASAIYRIGRRMPVSRSAALAGSAAWLFAPYVALDLYVRAAFAEAAALAVAPLALLGLLRALDRPSPSRVAMGGLAMALVLLGHNAVALLMTPVWALLVLLHGRAADSPRRSLAAGGATVLAGLGLSIYFWLPALVEKRFVKLELNREGYFQWSNHAVSLLQLLWSRWGYGLSVPGTADDMSFALGPVHLLLAGAGLVFALRSKQRVRRAEGTVFAVAAVAGAWLATSWSALLWGRVETLQFLQFPWRALMLPALFLPLLSMYTFERLGPCARTATLALLVFLNLSHTQPKGFLTFDDEYYSPSSIAQQGINTTTREEYEPRWVEVRPPYTRQKLIGVGAPLAVREVSLTTARQEFMVHAEADTGVEAATFYYPGWTITIDGTGVPVSPVPISGTMFFHLPRGEHRVVIELLPTLLRYVSWLVTAATLAIFALAFAAQRLRRSHSKLGIAWAQATPYGRAALWLLLVFSVFYLGLTRGHFIRTDDIAVSQMTRSLGSQEGLMQAGLDALYARNDPNTAAVQFRQVLEQNPNHYGATYQLAAALDQAGKRDEARPVWEKVLQMAEGYNDTPTADTARARLQKRP